MKLIETINNSTQTSVAALSRINLGNIDKSINQCAFDYNGIDTITLKQNGYYLVQVKVDVTSTEAAQTMSVALVGNNITSNVEAQVTEETSGTSASLTFHKIVKVANNSPLALNVINSGATATTFSNVIVSVIKIA